MVSMQKEIHVFECKLHKSSIRFLIEKVKLPKTSGIYQATASTTPDFIKGKRP